MHAWEQIQLTIDYIEEHLSEELQIEALAKMAALSPFYYQRLFRRLIKKPVSEYIKQRRLARAAEALPLNDRRIMDVALDFGFSSHETFTRSFKSAFGLTPEEYRANPVGLNRFAKPQLLLNYTTVDENVPLVVDGIMIEIARRRSPATEYFIGLSVEEPIGQLPGSGATGIDTLGLLWDDFHEKKPGIRELKAGGDELGVAYPGTKPGYYRYFAGAEAHVVEPPEGFAAWTLAEGEYIVCSFAAEDFTHFVMDALYKAQQYLFGTWLPNHGITVKPFSIERYASHEPDTTSMEIWVMPEMADAESVHAKVN
ncbi:AraC family transcriptional regulator [Paenibacillus timonensis]|uniref:Helix-turn-helix domain-containing protein n=1 Tax=Paenibacillus timonensis TaxID=225915 RepID=A0ABW3SC74_9BACL|nr:AraC family transcriptional regulator [Paenibacillus timonensis]MCH1640946.1 AraC family transcriptional regulator [Paenibacillus timonensis]